MSFKPPLNVIEKTSTFNIHACLTKISLLTLLTHYCTSSPMSSESSEVEPVIGQLVWCINESMQKWAYVGPYSIDDPSLGGRLELVSSGKLTCPQPNQSSDMFYCCGNPGDQYCCKSTDTPGSKWGVAVCVVVAMIIFLTVSYSIQVYRLCDRCYHECPSFRYDPDDSFEWDTRWYTVSHEGNRYGVTFHSRKFANEFMVRLESRHGRWNTANMLKISRGGQDFVILNIFFHDLFTPWFYTQGPIKNDEEWIRTDFKEMCQDVRSRLVKKPLVGGQECTLLACWARRTQRSQSIDTNKVEIEGQPGSGVDKQSTSSGSNHGLAWVPWTKAPYLSHTQNFEYKALKDQSDSRLNLPVKTYNCSSRSVQVRQTTVSTHSNNSDSDNGDERQTRSLSRHPRSNRIVEIV